MDLLGLDSAELSDYCVKLGYSSFRGKQIADWLYRKGVRDVLQMTNLPAGLREQLAADATIGGSEVIKVSKAPDETAKYLLKLSDGETIETVHLPYLDRTSVCVSTQVGCGAGCVFCATADCGFVRNLTAGEIVDQVVTVQEHADSPVSHVVFMGMGEPLLNLTNVLKAVHLLNDEMGISMRRLTISTVGITSAIRRLAEMDLQLTLAVSLHAADDDLRRKLIPIAEHFPLSDLMHACREYADRTKRRITFEYLLLGNVNDSHEHARDLAKLLRGILAHVNLIPYNPVSGKDYKRPSRQAIDEFRRTLEIAGIDVTQRMERGHAISAACGQLRRGFKSP
ncbi:MAG: 23S rRNA (adenine(2503)-C(2))-methyltransferase RlmN [Armatimonadetes bacterium]|nr:23S rRNA (adenine(2503)-C(2))-methyltransferase RlmN [Armatimonadota bacterium]